MGDVKLKYIETWTDRTGRIRRYFRRPGRERYVLPGEPGSPEFVEAYNAALKIETRLEVARERHKKGSFGRLVLDYMASSDFLRLAKSTQEMRRGILERFTAEHGDRLVAQMQREHVMKIMAKKASTPAAANNLLKLIRILIGFAIETRIRKDDPTIRIKKFRGGEYHTWTDDELARYEERWSLGTLERTAYAVHLYTGQRRGSGSRMAWPDYAGNIVRVTPDKGGDKLEIPAHPELVTALKAWGVKDVGPMLPSSTGRPYTVESYGNLMADAIEAAGLPERCVLHGLRKAAARRLAEAGCSTKEIQAITGHKTLAEVERYTRGAEQKRLAKAAIGRLST